MSVSLRRQKNKEKVLSLVNTLSKKGIQVVAVDFDQTLISIHSGGVWKDSINKLVDFVRPCMKDLMEAALERGLHVCIVTYFMQSWVIRDLLKKTFGRSEAEKIFVQANTTEFKEKHNHEFLGKEAHIAAVLTELYNRYHLIIKPEEIILFDDDKENIEKALEFGHWAIEVKDDISYDTFEEFAWQLGRKSTSKSKQ